jgi:GTPase involved in cell partitioning and DNA repair
MILHCVSLEDEKPLETYDLIRGELGKFDTELLKKEEWILLTKSDLCTKEHAEAVSASLKARGLTHVYILSGETKEGVKELGDTLVTHLRSQNS